MLRIFKPVAILEGFSFLFLLANMLIVKPIDSGLYETIKFPLGMVHGLLFIGYLIVAVMLKVESGWGWKKFLIVCLASVIPFGTFYIEKKYL